MLNRRELITAFLGWQVANSVGCSRRVLPPEGELLHTNFGMGHAIRDGSTRSLEATDPEHVGVAIVGGGIAGLSAAWCLDRSGFNDFVLLELEDRFGGTARSGRTGSFQYPWGAHYIPTPMPENRALVALLDEMKVVDRVLEDGTPVIAEQYLCRDPEERLFVEGRWQQGLYPHGGASEDDLRQWNEFQSEIDRWVDARDEQGRRMFAVPRASGSDSEVVRQLDTFSMATWLAQNGWDSPRLMWFVDYACRDDYGLTMERVSAWAGIFYFAARVRSSGEESQDVMTWPEGNGRIVRHFTERLHRYLRSGMAVRSASPLPIDEGVSVEVWDTASSSASRIQANQVIFAAPQMLTKYVVRGPSGSAQRNVDSFHYGSWLVANVHLRDRPTAAGFPMCWDNVFYESKSLGYVTSTHQTGIDHGPTVLTWYFPFADVDAKLTRQQMLKLEWSDWADLVMTDLRVAHRDIDDLVTRIDVMCWGHAMIEPRPGFLWSGEREQAAQPVGAIHFAGTDLSGIALFEEAFYHGIRAAEEVMRVRGFEHASLL